MGCCDCFRIFIGLLIIICVLGGWFGSAVFCGLWWDYVRIDFPAFGGHYLFFSILVLLNWFLPAVFLVLTILSLVFDCCKSGNIISSFLSGIGIIALVGGLVMNPFLVAKSMPYECKDLFNEPRDLMSNETKEQWDDWIAKKTKGMSDEDRTKFVNDLDDLRCDKAGKFHWYFFGAQLLSVLLTFILMPLYLCK